MCRKGANTSRVRASSPGRAIQNLPDPMGHPDRPLWSLSARELALGYAGGLSPDEVMAATLARIDEINPKLNAIVTLDAAGAIASAAASARRWREGRPLGPL